MKTKIFKSGNSLAVRLPKALELSCGPVSIHREGRKIIIEEVTENGWPDGFFESVRISRKDFGREKTAYVEKVL
jgi:virulence-associated protein VagC